MLITIIVVITIDSSQAFCPYYLMKGHTNKTINSTPHYNDRHSRALYDSLSYYNDADQTCTTNNCFMNDGGNLDAHHKTTVTTTNDNMNDGSSSSSSTTTYLSTFDIMAELSNNYDGSDMCVFSMQELRLPNNEISAENLAKLIYLGDSAGRRMHEFAQSNSDNVLLAACTIGRIGAKEACSNAKQGVDGYEYFTVGDDDDDSSDNTTPTYYKERFCKKSITQTQIDHPHAISIFRLNSNNYETTEALLEEFRESHANNIEWAYNTQIGADGHLLAKIIPCDQISDKFKNPSNMYPNLSNDNSICDYVGSNGKQFAQEALLEWQSLCSIWPLNDDGSIPKCHGKMLSAALSKFVSFDMEEGNLGKFVQSAVDAFFDNDLLHSMRLFLERAKGECI